MRQLAVEAAGKGLLAPELANGITRAKAPTPDIREPKSADSR